MPIGDSDDSEFYIYPVPDKVYGLKINYYTDMMELDITGTLMATLYKRARNVFIQGVYAKQLQDDDDQLAPTELQRYNLMAQEFVFTETYGKDLHNINMTVAVD